MPKIISNKSNVDLDYPVVRPSLDLDFTQEELDPRITFSRGSIGTRVNRNRLIETVDANQPRFDYDPVTGECKGLLIEESRTNFFPNSIPTLATWGSVTSVSFSTNAATSPDGSVTATLLTATAINNQTRIEHPGQRTTATTYTQSCFCKAGTTNYVTFGLYDTTTGTAVNRQAIFYLVGSGSVTFSQNNVSTSITPYPNGWYRCTMTTTISTGASYSGSNWKIGVCNNSTAYYNANIGDSVYIWGAQLEASGTPTSYIPTSGSTVTRSTDLARMTGTNFSSWYNPTEGTLYAAVRTNALGGSGYPGIAYVDDGTLNNCIGLVIMDAVTDRVAAEAYVSGANQFFYNSNSAIVPNQLSKVIASYSLNNYSAAFSDRDNIQRDINGLIPTVNRLILGDLRGGNGRLNGVLARFTYYPRKLKDNQLLYLTQ